MSSCKKGLPLLKKPKKSPPPQLALPSLQKWPIHHSSAPMKARPPPDPASNSFGETEPRRSRQDTLPGSAGPSYSIISPPHHGDDSINKAAPVILSLLL